MTIQIIGVGVGRTGTHSLKHAINQLGFGPCHHMEDVFMNMPVQAPLWRAALNGEADWGKIYDGYKSAVDWPTAGFFPELIKAYPSAKFVLTHRDPQSWVESYELTIHKLVSGQNDATPEQKDWLNTVAGIRLKTGFPEVFDREDMIKSFMAHNEAVKATIPEDQLLTYEVKEGWAPLCKFLNVPEPSEAFPRSNDRSQFWENVSGKH